MIFEGNTQYERSDVPYYSETQRTWAEPQDWTREGIEILTLWFYGNPKDIEHADPAALTTAAWQQWRILCLSTDDGTALERPKSRRVHKVIGAQLQGFPAVGFEIGEKDEG